MSVADRVAFRYAKEFSTPEQKQEYLEAHPGADPAKHTVKKPEKQAPKNEDGHADKGHGDEDGHGDGHGHHAPKKNLKQKLQDMTDALKKATPATKKFVSDPVSRKETLTTAAGKIKKSPKTYLENLKKVWKHEKQEFKDAGAGIAAIMKGGKATSHQKHAIKTVARHLAITGAYSALTASGAGIAGSFLMSSVKYIAAKAVSESLASTYVLQKQGIIGHGLLHLLDKIAAEEKEVSPEEALQALVLKKVMEQLEKGMTDEDMAEALEDYDDKDNTPEKVARRVLATEAPDTNTLLLIRGELKKLRAWSSGFFNALKIAQDTGHDAPEGYVWQDEFVDFWEPFGPIQKRLFELQDSLPPDLAGGVDDFVDPPKPARIEEAINDPKFLKRNGKDSIAYAEANLLEWYEAFSWWVGYGIGGIDSLIS